MSGKPQSSWAAFAQILVVIALGKALSSPEFIGFIFGLRGGSREVTVQDQLIAGGIYVGVSFVIFALCIYVSSKRRKSGKKMDES